MLSQLCWSMSVDGAFHRDNTYRKLNTSLLGRRKREDVGICPFVHTFKDSKVGNDTSCVEVFEPL